MVVNVSVLTRPVLHLEEKADILLGGQEAPPMTGKMVWTAVSFRYDNSAFNLAGAYEAVTLNDTEQSLRFVLRQARIMLAPPGTDTDDKTFVATFETAQIDRS